MIELQLNDELVEGVQDYMMSKGYAIGTIKNYSNHLLLLKKKYKVINKQTILKIIQKYKTPYHRAVISLINEYCFFAEIDFNLKVPRQVKQKRKIPSTLPFSEVKKIIAIVKEKLPNKDYDLMLRCIFGFGAGLRISEAIKMSYIHFNWSTWIETKEGQGIYMIQETKRGNSFPVTVPANLMKDIYERAKRQSKLNEYGIPNGLVFKLGDFKIEDFEPVIRMQNPNEWKYKYTKKIYNYFRYHVIQKVIEPSIGYKIKIHWLRHSKATFLLEQGLTLEEISKLLGHQDIQTSLIYARVNIKKTIEKMKSIEEI